MPDAKTALVAHKVATRRVAKEIGRRLARLYRILPMHVVAYELKSGRTRQSDIIARIPAMIDLLEAQGRNCRTLNTLSDKEVFEQGTAQLRHLNAVTVHAGDVSPIKADIVNYCAHAVDPARLGAVVRLGAGSGPLGSGRGAEKGFPNLLVLEDGREDLRDAVVGPLLQSVRRALSGQFRTRCETPSPPASHHPDTPRPGREISHGTKR